MNTSPSCPFVVCDGIAMLSGTSRCDNGSDDSNSLQKISQAAVLNGIGRMETIAPVKMQVALASAVDDLKEAYQKS